MTEATEDDQDLRRAVPRAAFGHYDGYVFAEADGADLHVLEDSVAEAVGLGLEDFRCLLADRAPELAPLGGMPSYDGFYGRFLRKAHVAFLLARPELATQALRTVAAVIGAHGNSGVRIEDGLVVACAGTVLPVERWRVAPAEFLRDEAGLLRIRHDALARLFGRGAVDVARDVRRLRHGIEDASAKVVERFEFDEGKTVVGLYLTMPHAARLADLIGLSGEAVLDSFRRWPGFAASGAVGPGAEAVAALRAELAALRADFVAAGVLPGQDAQGGAPGRRPGLGLRGLLFRIRRRL